MSYFLINEASPDSLKPLEASFYSTNRFLKPAAVTGMLYPGDWIYWPVCLQIEEASVTNAPAMFLCGAEQQSASGTDLTPTTMLSLLIQTLSNMAATDQSQVRLMAGCSVWSLPPPPLWWRLKSGPCTIVKMLEPVLVQKSHTLNCFFVPLTSLSNLIS